MPSLTHPLQHFSRKNSRMLEEHDVVAGTGGRAVTNLIITMTLVLLLRKNGN